MPSRRSSGRLAQEVHAVFPNRDVADLEEHAGAEGGEPSARDHGPIQQPQVSAAKPLKQERHRPPPHALPPPQARADFKQRPRLGYHLNSTSHGIREEDLFDESEIVLGGMNTLVIYKCQLDQ